VLFLILRIASFKKALALSFKWHNTNVFIARRQLAVRRLKKGSFALIAAREYFTSLEIKLLS